MDALAWCRDRMLVPGNPMAASLAFAPDDERDAILALRTLVGELGALAEISEASVAEAKLGWWRETLRDEHSPGRRHPVVQALEQTEVLQRVPASEFESVADAIATLEARPRFERVSELKAFCLRIGGPMGRLESRLLDADQGLTERFAELAAAAYLVRLVRDLAIDARAERWWVPLELQADYQVSRNDVITGQAGTGFDGLVRSLIHEAMSQARLAIDGLDRESGWRHRHLLIHWSLDRRLALTIDRKPRRLLDQRLLPSHAGNVWRAWRTARRLRRGKSI